MKLHTTAGEFDSLWIAFNSARGTQVIVPRGALFNLLKDHGLMAEALKIDSKTASVHPGAGFGAGC